MATDTNDLAIPIIDIEPLRSGTLTEAKITGKQVYEAFRDVGFAYIQNHGVPQELVNQAFDWVSCLVSTFESDILTQFGRALNSLLFLRVRKTRRLIRLMAGGTAVTLALAGRR